MLQADYQAHRDTSNGYSHLPQGKEKGLYPKNVHGNKTLQYFELFGPRKAALGAVWVKCRMRNCTGS